MAECKGRFDGGFVGQTLKKCCCIMHLYILAFHVHHVPNIYGGHFVKLWLTRTLLGRHVSIYIEIHCAPYHALNSRLQIHDLTNCYCHVWKVTLSLLDHCTVVLSITLVFLYNWDWHVLVNFEKHAVIWLCNSIPSTKTTP